MQVCIEAIIDISERIISLENSSPVSTSYKALERLENLGIIKDSSKYKQMIQFRNLFENESVDTQKMIFVIDNYFNVFEDYINEIK